MRGNWWLLAIFLALALSGLGGFFFWKRQNQNSTSLRPQQATADLFLAAFPPANTTVTATVTVTSAATSVATATTSAAPAWRDFRIPPFLQVTERYAAEIGRARELIGQPPFTAAPGSPPPDRVELDTTFGQRITTAAGLQVDQMFDKRTGELVSERWQDPVLGQVSRHYHPEFESVSLTGESSQLKVNLIPISRDQVEYLTVQEPEQGFVSLLEGNRRTEFWANLRENRFVEYQDRQPTRQWRRVGENRFQEIDERGQGLSFYRVNRETGGIELAE